jgi:hypothetical protein
MERFACRSITASALVAGANVPDNLAQSMNVWTTAAGLFFRATIDPAVELLLRHDLPSLRVSIGCTPGTMTVERVGNRHTVVQAMLEEVSLLRRPRFEDTWVLPWCQELEDRIVRMDLEARARLQDLREAAAERDLEELRAAGDSTCSYAGALIDSAAT